MVLRSSSEFRLGPNKAMRLWPGSGRSGSFDLLHCGRFCRQCQFRFALIFRVYESDVGQADKREDMAQIRFLKIELSSRSTRFVRSTTRSEHVHFLAGQQSFRSGFSERKRLAEAHNLVKPGLEPSRDREVVHWIA